MDRSGQKRCLLGLALLLASPLTGSFGWMARLLGLIGVANGTARGTGIWLARANRLSVAAVVFFALAEIARLTGLLPARGAWQGVLSTILTALLAICLLAGRRKHNEEETK